MKATAPGTLLFAPNGHVTMTGWTFDAEHGESCDLRQPTVQLACLRACLIFVARNKGVSIEAPEGERFDLDSERETLDVIAQVRWQPR